jgi:uncharacterized membrane protein (UPF0127 family)
MKTRTLRRLLATLIAPLALQSAARAAGTIELTVGIRPITVEVARTDPERMRGLMYREVLPDNHGMLFLFGEARSQCMWMRNTLLPLSVAFLDDDGTIANIEEMQPRTETTHCSVRSVRYALEMPAGWFARRGIRAGHAIKGMPPP